MNILIDEKENARQSVYQWQSKFADNKFRTKRQMRKFLNFAKNVESKYGLKEEFAKRISVD